MDNMTVRRKIVASFLLCFYSGLAFSENVYIVKRGDRLSDILFQENITPIYGKKGSWLEIVKLNPKLLPTMGNKLLPGMKISLGNRPAIIVSNKIVPEKITEKIGDIKKVSIERNPSGDFKQSFYWRAGPELSWKNLISTDDNALQTSHINALTNANYGASVAYGMHFTEDLDIYSRLSLESVSFIEAESVHLLKNNFLTSNFGMGMMYEKKWSLEMAMSDQFFLTSPSSSIVSIKKITLPEIKPSYLGNLYQFKNAQLFYSLSGSLFLPRTSTDINSKFCYGAGGEIVVKLHQQSFNFGYDTYFLKATNNSTQYQNIYWKFFWETL